MTTPALDLGLLLDVDGPIASPLTRTINIPSIARDLVSLTAAGVPIAFITGRSDAFIRDNVVSPLLDIGLGDALARPGARMFGVFEKGAVWAPITSAGVGEVTIDHGVAVTAEHQEVARRVVEAGFSDSMFFDDTKHAMISIEQSVEVTNEQYKRAQAVFQDAVFDALTQAGMGLTYGDRRHRDDDGALPFRIDPTVISTDIESVLLDKDRGTRRALEQFAAAGELPRRWRSVGDSRSDYTMADELYRQGFDVAHVDVRPSDGLLTKPYEVIVEGDLIHDEAGAAFLRHWAAQLPNA